MFYKITMMKTSKFLLFAALFLLIAALLTSCREDADPGPIQQHEEEYAVSDFDRLEVGDAFDLTIIQGTSYSVKVTGDRRNIEDLEVKRSSSTLRVRFAKHDRNDYRQYRTYIIVTMPALSGVDLSGAVTARVSGFTSDFDMDVELSGASQLDIAGAAKSLDADISGASTLHGFEFETKSATIEASGASNAEILATQTLNARASGASNVRYRGNPAVSANTSGASVVEPE